MVVAAAMSIEDICYLAYMKTLGRPIIPNSDGSLPIQSTDGMIYRGFIDGFKGHPMTAEITQNEAVKFELRQVYIGAYRAGKRYRSSYSETTSSSISQ